MSLKLDENPYPPASVALPLQAGAFDEPAGRGAARWTNWFARRPSRFQWLIAFALLALGQVFYAGYELGVGNQTIQIPFLRHWQDPALFADESLDYGADEALARSFLANLASRLSLDANAACGARFVMEFPGSM
jgi:hypothetical protein